MKKILIFLSLIIIIVGVATVNATDEINTDTTTIDCSNDDVAYSTQTTSSYDNNNGSKLNSDKKNTKTTTTTYNNLKQADSSNITSVDIISLDDGIHYYDYLNITNNTDIFGRSQNNTIIINRNTNHNAMIENHANLTITNLTITNSSYCTILNYGNLTINGVTITNSTGKYISDGFIRNYANITINKSYITNIYYHESSIINDQANSQSYITIADSYFENNMATYETALFSISKSHFMMINSTVENHINNSIKYLITFKDTTDATIKDTVFRDNSIATSIINTYTSNLKIINSKFKNNNVNNLATCIISNTSNITCDGCEFINNTSLNDAAGVMLSYNSNVTFNNTNFTQNSAVSGGVIVAINGSVDDNFNIIKNPSQLMILNSNFTQNSAKYMGGALYTVYTKLIVNNTSFINNHAQNGAVIYADHNTVMMSYSNITNNSAEDISSMYLYNVQASLMNSQFSKNSALYATDIYMPYNIAFNDMNNTYTHNNSKVFDVIIKKSYDNHTYNENSSIPDILPTYYNLADEGYVTSIKNQVSSGNCWAFAAIATLESCLIKSTDNIYDLSENNMKNIMALFSKNGWNKLTNDGGYDDMVLGYLLNWIGPVEEKDDKYNPYGYISSEMANIIQLSNVYGIPTRKNATDNNIIKNAILKYGAVYSPIYTGYGYNGCNLFYNQSTSINHAVVIVGWDDNYSRYNFRQTPQGDGAFIIKNSWGENAGDKGYFYVSYYDTTILSCIDDMTGCGGFTFTFDNMKYDKQYHYDYSGYNTWFSEDTNTITYSNEYKTVENEEIGAFGTYIYDITSNVKYSAKIYVNGVLKYTQDGSFKKNYIYERVDLQKPVYTKTGDMVCVELTLTSDKIAAVPIEYDTYSRFIANNLSKINKESYSDAVVSLKLYSKKTTTHIQADKLYAKLLNVTVYDDEYNILDNGIILIKYNNETLTQVDVNSEHTIINTIKYHLPEITLVYVNDNTNASLNVTLDNKKQTQIILDNIDDVKYNSTVNITGRLIDVEDMLALDGYNITLQINNNIYTLTTDENGYFNYMHKMTTITQNNITLTYLGDRTYESSMNTTSFITQKLDVNIILTKINGIVGEDITLNATIIDENGNYVNGGNMVFKINGVTLKDDDTFNQSGVVQKFSVRGNPISKTIEATIYIRDAKNLTASYSGSSIYNMCTSDVSIVDIAKRYANVSVNVNVKTQENSDKLEIVADITDTTRNSNRSLINTGGYIIIKVDGITLKDKNGNQLKIKVENNKAQYTYTLPYPMKAKTANGSSINHEVVVIYTNNNYYPTARDNMTFNIGLNPTQIINTNAVVNKTSNKLSLNATVYDTQHERIISGGVEYILKINDKTLKDEKNNTMTFKTKDGIINIQDLSIPKANNYTNITVILKDSQIYQSSRITTPIKTLI